MPFLFAIVIALITKSFWWFVAAFILGTMIENNRRHW